MDKLTCSPDEFDDDSGVPEVDSDDGDEDQIDHFKHNKLLEAVRTIGGKKSATGHRTEATLTVSEHTLSNAADNKIDVGDLLSSLGKTSKLATLRKKVLKAKRKGVKVLPPPLSKPETEKIHRTLAYEKVCKEVSKWDKIVEQNRQADQLTFPLKQPNIFVEPMSEVVQRFKLRTPLEMEMAALLQERDPEVKRGDDVHKLEKAKRQLAFQEAMLKRSDVRKMRALQSYREVRNKWKSKIKSKSYHRILKKERLKKHEQEFEELRKLHPELADEKLEDMERHRAEERMNLRHRNTGKWAKYQIIRSKYDKESSRNIQEQLNLNRQLTVKQKIASDSEDDGEQMADDGTRKVPLVRDGIPRLPFGSSANPWMSSGRKIASDERAGAEEAESDEAITSFRKYWNEINEKSRMQREGDGKPEVEAEENNLPEKRECKTETVSTVRKADDGEQNEDEDETETTGEDEVDEIFAEIQRKQKRKAEAVAKLEKPEVRREGGSEEEEEKNEDDDEEGESHLAESLVRKQRLEDFDDMEVEKVPEVRRSCRKPDVKSNPKGRSAGKPQSADVAVDPNDFINVEEKVIKFRAPNMSGYQEDVIDDDVDGDNRMTIAEAFANDDVVSEFRNEKQALIDQNKPKSIDLSLPGWGQWGGTGIKVSKSKRRRFTIQAPPAPARKDSEIGNVIINENTDDMLKSHLLSAVPKSFHSARDFKRSLRQPIGKNWNPETAFARLIAPKVVTKMGQVIEPMDEDAIKESTQRRRKNARSRAKSSTDVNLEQ